MKKLILAAAIAGITAGTAQAATVYEGKGLKYDIKGDWQVQLRDNASKTKDLEVEFDDLELKNRVQYDLGNGLTAFGQLDFGFKDAAESKQDGDSLEEAYLGLDFGSASVQVGKMDKAADDFGVEQAYESPLGEDIFDEFGTGSGDDVIRADASFGAVRVAASHELEAEGEDSEGNESSDIYVEAGFDALTLGAAYQTFKSTPTAKSTDIWGVSAVFDAGFATFGADYGVSDQAGTSDVAMLDIVATFKATKQIKIAVGYVEHDYDDAAANSEEAIYANLTYKFPEQKNVSMFAEITNRDDDANTDYELDVLAGMRIKF
ncbi:porin [Motiliproteus sediminis]|uniref:porin n=1 Tax=Motiliproteus sediminis TaxID=1468178 RepID=UPI001AEFE720|nr:porin [Motiliproteus sediminis]